MASEGSIRVGVYVDVVNIMRNGGYGMQYEVLREFACRGGGEPIRLNAYVSFDSDRAGKDPTYRTKTESFFSTLRDFGYKVIQKEVKWYRDEAGNLYPKANADLEMAVDALLQSDNLDRVLLATGDGDFVQVVRALQNNGCRVEVVAFESVSTDLRREADLFISGFVIPNLLQVSQPKNGAVWGEEGSRVRGTCYYHHQTQSYGFLRFLRRISPDLWITDTRRPDSPYGTAFFHDSNLPSGVDPGQLPSRRLFFEFDLVRSERDEEKLQAVDIQLVAQL